MWPCVDADVDDDSVTGAASSPETPPCVSSASASGVSSAAARLSEPASAVDESVVDESPWLCDDEDQWLWPCVVDDAESVASPASSSPLLERSLSWLACVELVVTDRVAASSSLPSSPDEAAAVDVDDELCVWWVLEDDELDDEERESALGLPFFDLLASSCDEEKDDELLPLRPLCFDDEDETVAAAVPSSAEP